MKILDKKILQKLKRPSPDSHKGQNGRLLVIAGSDKFHGALLLAVQSASRIVDLVYVHSIDKNLKLIDKLKSEMATFISVFKDELWETVDFVDAVIVGPGLEESKENIDLVEKLLKKYQGKKIIVDATALWHVDPLLLHPDCIATPHSREFEHVFKAEPTPENVQKMAKRFQCIIVLKGRYDYISDGNEIWENQTGNVGMTKGGTGDVLAGLIAGLATTNDVFTSALAGTYLSGLAGDRLYEKTGAFYNAEDLIEELGRVWKEEIF